MTVQDDERERELCRAFNLIWDPSHERGGTDAHFPMEIDGKTYRVDVEVKSTTHDSVSTARDVGLAHIEKWRGKFWIIGFYSKDAKRPELRTSLCLTPPMIEPWVKSIEEKIRPDFRIAELASRRLTLADLADICGAKDAYDIADAKKLHKRQWTDAQYREAPDITVGGRAMLSPARMLEILQLRAKYVAERGATLNNPHIDKGFLKQYFDSRFEVRDNQAAAIREIARAYMEAEPTHPFEALTVPRAD
jgi:hypothetical protein